MTFAVQPITMSYNSRVTHWGADMANKERVSKTRARRLARFGRCYMPFKPPGHWRESSCVYCGNKADTKDHIPPLAWMECLGPDWFEDKRMLIIWVPSCKECNTALRDNKLFTIRERTGWLIDHYMRKYDKLATVPVWTKEQISELRGRLKQSIEQFAFYQVGIDRRLQILEENYALRSVREEL